MKHSTLPRAFFPLLNVLSCALGKRRILKSRVHSLFLWNFSQPTEIADCQRRSHSYQNHCRGGWRTTAVITLHPATWWRVSAYLSICRCSLNRLILGVIRLVAIYRSTRRSLSLLSADFARIHSFTSHICMHNICIAYISGIEKADLYREMYRRTAPRNPVGETECLKRARSFKDACASRATLSYTISVSSYFTLSITPRGPAIMSKLRHLRASVSWWENTGVSAPIWVGYRHVCRFMMAIPQDKSAERSASRAVGYLADSTDVLHRVQECSRIPGIPQDLTRFLIPRSVKRTVCYSIVFYSLQISTICSSRICT